MMVELGSVISVQLTEHLAGFGQALLAVPGGTTPGPIFDVLSVADLEWEKISVMLTDERWVPETSSRSNTRLIKSRLLTGKAASAMYLPLFAEGGSVDEKLPQLSANIAPKLPLSVCLLGMGTDMHTASIFPEADKLTEALTGTDILYPMTAPGAPEPRVTLSANVLRASKNIHIVITGKQKRAALDKALCLEPIKAPIAAVLENATVHWAEK